MGSISLHGRRPQTVKTAQVLPIERCARGQHANVLVRTADDGLHLARLAPVHDDDGVNVAFVLVVLVDVACALDTQVADD